MILFRRDMDEHSLNIVRKEAAPDPNRPTGWDNQTIAYLQWHTGAYFLKSASDNLNFSEDELRTVVAKIDELKEIQISIRLQQKRKSDAESR